MKRWWWLCSLLVACAAGSAPVADSPRDPSNPNAPAGTTGPAADPHAGHAAPAGSAGEVVYACPMHPEVTASAPGTCPKCGMALVRKP